MPHKVEHDSTLPSAKQNIFVFRAGECSKNTGRPGFVFAVLLLISDSYIGVSSEPAGLAVF
jgi:hypothetical protein